MNGGRERRDEDECWEMSSVTKERLAEWMSHEEQRRTDGMDMGGRWR